MYHDLFALAGYNYLRGVGFFPYSYIVGLWSGSVLFFFFLKKVAVKLFHLDVVEICLLLILLTGVVLYFAFSLNLLFMWEPHMEYILIIIPCIWLFLFKNLAENRVGKLLVITAICFITSNALSWFYGLLW